MNSQYNEFLSRKKNSVPAVGFTVADADINPILFGWQRQVVAWAVHQGRAALFEECGLGKTFQQLEWARLVHEHTGRDVLILAPLAVNSQTIEEGRKLGISVNSCRAQSDVKPGVNITNYEMLDHFNGAHFAGVVLDESSILKSFMGKIKRQLVDMFAGTLYKLCCTATPAPNDHMEIGNHCDFLGIMASNEMISRWFINDTMNMGGYRVKAHAANDFWEWVASWAVSMRRPSDLGFSDEGYSLPPLNVEQIVVDVDETEESDGALFRLPTISATTMHKEMRLTCEARALRASELVAEAAGESWAVWCNTNYEADVLRRLLPEAIEVRGSDSMAKKETSIVSWIHGERPVLISKPSICGFGMNFQHCHNAVFVGLSYSFEQLYQAIRRFYRFGQTRPVNVYIITARTEGAILQSIQTKIESHATMMEGMVKGRRTLQSTDALVLQDDSGDVSMALPEWLQAA